MHSIDAASHTTWLLCVCWRSSVGAKPSAPHTCAPHMRLTHAPNMCVHTHISHMSSTHVSPYTRHTCGHPSPGFACTTSRWRMMGVRASRAWAGSSTTRLLYLPTRTPACSYTPCACCLNRTQWHACRHMHGVGVACHEGCKQDMRLSAQSTWQCGEGCGQRGEGSTTVSHASTDQPCCSHTLKTSVTVKATGHHNIMLLRVDHVMSTFSSTPTGHCFIAS